MFVGSGLKKVLMGETSSVFGDFPSFRYLQVFETVARFENVSRAAVEVHMSQPAVTQAVLKIEDWVGRKLFGRSSTGTFLTREGLIFQRRVHQMFAQVESALAGEVFAPASNKDLQTIIGRLKSAHVNVLVALSTNCSVNAAVQSLGQSRSTMWRTARELEHILGCSLFDRGAGGLVAGAAACRLAPALTRAYRELTEGAEEIAAFAGSMRCRLFVGAQKLALSSLLASTINEVLSLYPDTSVTVAEGTHRQLLHDLRGGRLDMIFGSLEAPAGSADVIEEPLIHDAYCVVGRTDHPLRYAPTITLSDLGHLEWVLPGGVSQRRRAFQKLFHEIGYPKSCITVAPVSTQISILRSSDRVTLLPKFELSLEEEFRGLMPLPFDVPIERFPDGLTMRANATLNAAQACFRELLWKRLRNLGLPLDPAGPKPLRIAC
jgi:LysR family transcriptional regulator, regulator for genes of the gallate degradation pathway